jgi:prolyl-tRNA synthetase
MVGGLIMGHGDDTGLVVPPRLAPIQVVVLLVRDEGGAGDAADRLAAELRAAGVRVRLDAQVATSFGRRAVDWELKGVPVRVLVGPRDLAEGRVGVVRRDTGEETQVGLGEVAGTVARLLEDVQASMLAGAMRRRDGHTAEVTTIEDAAEAAKTGFAKLPWALLAGGGEARLARDGVSVRCLQRPDGTLPASEDEADLVAYVARSY